MSAEIKPVSFRLEPEYLGKIDQLRDCLPAFAKPKRADVIRLAVDFLHAVVFMRLTLQAAAAWLQRFLSITLHSQLDLPAESPRFLPDTSGARDFTGVPRSRSANGSISQSSRVRLVELGMEAYAIPPFSLVTKGGVA